MTLLSRTETLARMQQVMGPLPAAASTRPPSVRTLLSEQFPSYTRHKITYEAEPGDHVPAWLLEPHAPATRAAICLHSTQRSGKDETAGIGQRFSRHTAKELAERGYLVISPDYPNFGEYYLDVYALGYQSASMKGIVNHRRAVDLLLSHRGIRSVAAIGHSLGGHNALFLAAFDERISATVTSCGFTSFAKYYGGDLTGWSHRGYMPRIASIYNRDPRKMPFDFPDVLAAIAPRSLFVNAPLHDANFDVSGVRDCLQLAGPLFPKQNLEAVYPDSEHDFPTEARLAAWRFLDARLAQ
ncbi:MAG: alpha/beta fold hydrolase [Bryobacterales bacterium]|nr:alpha/beta fold hydrolase [Bryobacterales bacterium]